MKVVNQKAWQQRLLGDVAEQALRALHECPVLPLSLQESQHSLFDLILGAWTPDGRKNKNVGGAAIAKQIKEKIGRNFDRNTFTAIFFERMVCDKRYRQVLKRDEAKAFLEIAFTNWSTGPISYDPPIDIEKTIQNCCDAIFNYDWSGRRTDLSPLLQLLVESERIPITLQHIEEMIEEGFHKREKLSPEAIAEFLQKRMPAT